MEQTVTTDVGVENDGNENGHQKRDETSPFFVNLLQRLEITEGRDEQQRDNEPNHQQLDDKQDDDENLKRVLPTRI